MDTKINCDLKLYLFVILVAFLLARWRSLQRGADTDAEWPRQSALLRAWNAPAPAARKCSADHGGAEIVSE